MNSQLVGQLASALKEEYQTSEYLSKDPTPKTENNSETETNTETSESTDTNVVTDTPKHSSSSNSGDLSPEDSESNELENSSENTDTTEPAKDVEDISEPPVKETDSPSKIEVTESSRVSGTSVLGSLPRSDFKDMRQVSDQIKGMLNFKDSTQGVNRILYKENELWIYYNDSVNLNNVMADVIELLNASGYTYLEFNRLARSDNAMVFQVDFADTSNVIKELSQNK